METRVERGQSSEDRFTGAIALGSMAASAILKLSGKDDWALFVGQWAAPFLIVGNYDKMVKQDGSDALNRSAA